MIGLIVVFSLMIWTLFTFFIFGTAGDFFTFARSIYFPIICVGYIIILAIYPFWKRMNKEDDYYY
jgi:hypothetical protein